LSSSERGVGRKAYACCNVMAALGCMLVAGTRRTRIAGREVMLEVTSGAQLLGGESNDFYDKPCWWGLWRAAWVYEMRATSGVPAGVLYPSLPVRSTARKHNVLRPDRVWPKSGWTWECARARRRLPAAGEDDAPVSRKAAGDVSRPSRRAQDGNRPRRLGKQRHQNRCYLPPPRRSRSGR
jgi:hypothetical protein